MLFMIVVHKSIIFFDKNLTQENAFRIFSKKGFARTGFYCSFETRFHKTL